MFLQKIMTILTKFCGRDKKTESATIYVKVVCLVEIASFNPPKKARSIIFSGNSTFVLKYGTYLKTSSKK